MGSKYCRFHSTHAAYDYRFFVNQDSFPLISLALISIFQNTKVKRQTTRLTSGSSNLQRIPMDAISILIVGCDIVFDNCLYSKCICCQHYNLYR